MSVAMSILAMVAEGPRYGYELRAEFGRRTGLSQPLNIGQVYKTLERLEREGLVTKNEATDADGHVFYDITEAGRAASHEWLTTSDPVPAPGRDDLAIKLAIAVTLPGVDIDALLRAQRGAAIVRLQELTRTAGTAPVASGEALGARLVADAAIFEAETRLRWLEQVAERVRAARASGIDPVVPFDTERPRRGRPSATRSADTREQQ